MVNIQSETEKVVNELTRNRKLFSAYDVTRIMRHRLDGENVSHNEVKNKVHEMYENDEMGIYERTQVNIGRRIAPFIYHLNHQDPDTEYDKDWVDSYLPTQTQTVISPIDGSPLDDDDDDDSTTQTVQSQNVQVQRVNSQTVANRVQSLSDGFKTFSVTKEGRLNIPVKMLKHFPPHAHISQSVARKDGKNVNALSISTNPINSIKSYKVDVDGRIRISKRFLKRIGISSQYAVKECSANLGHSVILVVAE